MVDLDPLLEATSRTFALAIPLLPEPTRREVSVAYLLFRIADTFEDATQWAPGDRTQALHAFAGLLDQPPQAAAGPAARWAANPPHGHAGYRTLLQHVPQVIEALHGLSPPARDLVRAHVRRSAAGMARFVEQRAPSGRLALRDLAELRDYCYVVAGLVGEMLTELFLLGRPALVPVAPLLRRRARFFGEGLQLVNVLKDAHTDASEGRDFLPPDVPLAAVHAVARRDLDRAAAYVRALQRAGAPPGLIAFNALPVFLAHGTLDRVEAEGPGAKLSRAEVFGLMARLEEALATPGRTIDFQVRRPVPAALR